MLLLVIGLICVGVTIPMWIVLWDELFVTPAALILLIFDTVGIVLIFKGLSKIIKDTKTKKHGVETYAQIDRIMPSGTYVNGVPELKGEFTVYNPLTFQVEKVSEILGVGAYKYQVNQIVKAKYYEGDINIINIVYFNEVPSDISRFFTNPDQVKSSVSIPTGENVTYGDVIEIDGVKYKKVD